MLAPAPIVHPWAPLEEGMLAGRGAWQKWGHYATGDVRTYRFESLKTQDGSPMDPAEFAEVHHAIAGIQRAFNQVGYRHPLLGAIPVTGRFGPRTSWGVRWYQRNNGLKEDGIFGPATATSLFRTLVLVFAAYYKVPALPLLGMIGHESGFDPAAVSFYYKPVNGKDRGLAQINKNAHAEVTDAQAFDALFAIGYAVERYRDAQLMFPVDATHSAELQMYCCILQHNSPAAARQFYRDNTINAASTGWAYISAVLAKGAQLMGEG